MHHDPAHPGESLLDVMLAEGWTVTETAEESWAARGRPFSRLLNGSYRHLAGDGLGIGAYRVEATRRSGCAGRRSTTWRRSACRGVAQIPVLPEDDSSYRPHKPSPRADHSNA